MRKIIKRYICVIAILSTMVGYGQIDQNITTFKISPVINNTVTVTVTVINTVTNTVSFLKAMPVVLYTPPPITAPTINIQEVLNNPSSSVEDKEKAAEALAIQRILEGQAEAARAQIQALLIWVEAQSQAQAQAQAQSQAQAQAEAEAFLTSVQQRSQSIANGGIVNTVTNPSLATWYMDYDGDGYHSSTQQKSTCPGALWKSSTNGPDCEDKDATKTTDCSGALTIKGWFLDNDYDGWHAEAKGATISPGPGWTSVMTKGPDCDDTVFSLDNSVCVAQTPPTPPDPCAKIKAQNSNLDYKAKIVLLKGKTGLKNETGVIQKADGTFLDYIPSSDPNHLVPPPGANFKGGIHTHIDPYASGKFRPDGSPIMLVPIPMFSPQDIREFLEFLVNTKTNNIPTADIYSTFVSSSGTYTLKFTGNITDVNTNFNWGTELDEKFKLAKNEYGIEKGFLLFLKDNIGINGITLYKINDDGTSENKSLDTNNLLQTTPCQ